MIGRSITQKVLEEHLVERNFELGKEIAIKIDQTSMLDSTGNMAYLQFEALGLPNTEIVSLTKQLNFREVLVQLERKHCKKNCNV